MSAVVSQLRCGAKTIIHSLVGLLFAGLKFAEILRRWEVGLADVDLDYVDIGANFIEFCQRLTACVSIRATVPVDDKSSPVEGSGGPALSGGSLLVPEPVQT
jgi:hypothetical protein